MAKYTGRRIVPKHAGEWDIRKEYEELQIVLDTDSGNSFISNLPVPKGTALDDEKYWSLFSLHSEQIAEAEEHLTQTAEDIRSELSETENRISKNVSDTEGRINESLSSTESKVNTSLSETESRVTARVENAKSDLTAKVAAAEQQMNQNAQNVAQTNKALNARMDQIAKGRTSDTEVLDARVDSEGNTFDNLGTAIRSIYPKAKEGLDALQESKVDANYDATGELTEGITVNTINGETQNFEHVQTTALIPVDTACQKVYYTGQVFNWIGVAGYDANGTFVASILDSRDTEQPQEYKEKELEIPEGVFQIRASSYAKDLNLKVCGESAKLWNQVQRERQNQKKMAIEIEALRSADDALAKETMTSLEYPDIIVILMSIDETGTYFPAKYPEYRASEITLGGLHSKNVSIYQYFCDELQDEANGVYVCSGHLIQPAVESYPTLDYVSADSVGRQSGRVLHMAYGRGQYGGPNWHPNNYAHCAWGYQLYALVKYTLALQDMK